MHVTDTIDRRSAATTDIALRAVVDQSPAAADLLHLLAFLDGDLISRRMLLWRRALTASPLLPALTDHGSLNESIGVLGDVGLVLTPGAHLAVHASTQNFVRQRLRPAEFRRWAALAAELVESAFPEHPNNPRTWRWCAEVAPHAFTVAEHLDHADDLHNLVRVADRLAAYLVAIGRFDRADALLERGVTVADRLERANNGLRATLVSRRGSVVALLGDLATGATLVEQALEAHRRDPGPRSREVADDLARLAKIQAELPDEPSSGPPTRRATPSAVERPRDRARRTAELAIALHREVLAPDTEEIAYDLELLGEIELGSGEFRQAFERLYAAADVLAAVRGDDDPEVELARSLVSALAEGLESGGLDAAAFERHRRRVEEVYGTEHFKVAESCRTLAELLAQSDPVSARMEILRALEIDTRVFGADHPTTVSHHFLIFVIEAAVRSEKAAKTAFRTGCRWIARRPEREGHIAATQAGLDNALSFLAGIAAEARLLRWARDTLIEECGPDHPAQIPVLRRLASAVHRETLDVHKTARAGLYQARQLIDRALELVTDQSMAGDLHATLAAMLATAADRYEENPALVEDAPTEVKRARAEALEAWWRAYEAHVEAHGSRSFSAAHDLVGAVPLLIRSGDLTQAGRCADVSIAIFEQLLGADHPEVVHLRESAVMVELRVRAEIDKGDEALAADDASTARYHYGLARSRAVATLTLEDDAVCCARLGFVDCLKGADDDATACFEEAITLWQRAGEPAPEWRLITETAQLAERFGAPASLRTVLPPLVLKTSGGAMTAFSGSLKAMLPPGWFAKESITLLAPDGSANVIASGEPLHESVDTERYAEVQGGLLANEFPEYVEVSFEPAEIFGQRRGYMRHFEWTPENGEPVTQIQLYFADRGRGYTATATVRNTVFLTAEPVLRSVLEALVVTESPKL